MTANAVLEREELAHIVYLTGELDLFTAPELARAVSAHEGPVRVDCRGVTFIGVAGFRVFEAAAAAKADHTSFVVCGLSAFACRTASIIGLEHLLCTCCAV